jgi:putative Mn2+ efflux pump MntP
VDIFTVLGIAMSLAIDCFAVSLAISTTVGRKKVKAALTAGSFFGLSQGSTTVLGWILGFALASFVLGYGHFVAFGLLAAIGGKMILEAGEERDAKGMPTYSMFFALAIATSIDSFSIGVGFALLSEAVFLPALLIGLVSFAFSVAGVFVGEKLGEIFKKRVEMLGGLVLIAIGLRILIETLV